MKNVYYFDFINAIKADFNIVIDKEVTLKLPANKKNIKNFTRSMARDVRIFDGNTEHPYMLTNGQRNEDILSIGKELRCTTQKRLHELITEYNLPVQSKPCRICEGNGWTSSGTRYIYKDLFIEL